MSGSLEGYSSYRLLPWVLLSRWIFLREGREKGSAATRREGAGQRGQPGAASTAPGWIKLQICFTVTWQPAPQTGKHIWRRLNIRWCWLLIFFLYILFDILVAGFTTKTQGHRWQPPALQCSLNNEERASCTIPVRHLSYQISTEVSASQLHGRPSTQFKQSNFCCG